ncbi:MerR family transcriptional regulator (plasmid) [Streptomyces sp. NBC_00873]|uniref:MerR family transcriptional regulator n=1 Tax=Streptomyces sp. NBC_00873 TaxID=2975852 RepID=UPI002F9178EB|nr:MerR family transcriptional regulator [Streptomyces sp. NBC_00873]
MGLLTIGAFAKASRLSPKALRLYGELGLLTPARVDPVTGYRLYAPDQLDQARLVAWLRRLGMPLARIQHVCTLEAGAAAQEVRAFWAQVEADTAARRELATFLIGHLSWKDPAMSPTAKPLGIRYAALSDAGLVRESNQDTAYAGSRLLAVADGFGRGGAPASAAAVDALKRLEADSTPAGNLLNRSAPTASSPAPERSVVMGATVDRSGPVSRCPSRARLASGSLLRSSGSGFSCGAGLQGGVSEGGEPELDQPGAGLMVEPDRVLHVVRRVDRVKVASLAHRQAEVRVGLRVDEVLSAMGGARLPP